MLAKRIPLDDRIRVAAIFLDGEIVQVVMVVFRAIYWLYFTTCVNTCVRANRVG